MRSFSGIIAITLVVFTLFSSEQIQKPNESIKSFSKAKNFLHRVIYGEAATRKTFYCGCSYDSGKNVDFESCGYSHRKNLKRARRIEWEHVVPAAAFGKNLPEWKNGHPECVDSKGKQFKGRNCASKMNRQFQLMQADMYNLVPAIGEVNADRSNFSFGDIPGEKRVYGKCDFEIENQTAEPAENIRGNIARIYMYMDLAYPGFDIINEKNKELIEEWNISDPVDTDECLRNAEIEKIQGNQNLITRKACLETSLKTTVR